MKIGTTIDNLIHLPRAFKILGNVSVYALLKKSGYFDIYNQVSEENLRDSLLQDQECIKEWLSYSENKRSNSGWYLQKEDEDVFVVGFFDGKNDKLNQHKYVDPIEACAIFIKHEIEDIRQS